MKNIIIASVLAFSTQIIVAQERQIREKYEKEYGQPGMDKLSGWLDKLRVNPKDHYDFNTSVTMHSVRYKKGKLRDEQDLYYFINTKQDYFGMRMEEKGKKKSSYQFVIYDFEANAVVMLNEEDKTGMAIALNGFMSGEAIKNREEGKVKTKETGEYKTTCKKTGDTKQILGYSCEEYICIDEDKNTKTEMWVTSKIGFNFSRPGVKGPFAAYSGTANEVKGMMMEAKFYKYDELESSFNVTNINEKEKVNYKSSDYDISNVSKIK